MIEQSGDSLIQKVRVRIGHDILSQVEIVQGDTARELHFFFEDYIVPTGAEYRIYLRKPSGLEVYKQCTLKDNEIIVQVTSQMSAEDGITQGQIQILKTVSDSEDKTILSTFPFTLLVAENISTRIISSNEFEILDGLIDEARVLIPQMESLISTFTEQENSRVEAEKIRVQNENERIDNENARKESETSRANAEKGRASAESSRVSAESERQAASAKAVEDCDNAVDRVNEILDKLQTSVNDFINDSVSSETTTFSSEKIESLITNQIQLKATEPENQVVGALWFIQE